MLEWLFTGIVVPRAYVLGVCAYALFVVWWGYEVTVWSRRRQALRDAVLCAEVDEALTRRAGVKRQSARYYAASYLLNAGLLGRGAVRDASALRELTALIEHEVAMASSCQESTVRLDV